MTRNKKIAIGLGIGLVAYWVWSRNKANKSLNPFAKSSNFMGAYYNDDSFYNVVDPRDVKFKTTSSGCQVYSGSCNASAGTIIDGNKIIVSNSSTSCVVCPRSNTSTGMPIRG